MLKKKSVNSRQISDVNSTISLSLSFWIIHNSDDLKGGGNTTVKTFLLQLILVNDMKLSVTYTIEFSSNQNQKHMIYELKVFIFSLCILSMPQIRSMLVNGESRLKTNKFFKIFQFTSTQYTSLKLLDFFQALRIVD